MEGKFESVIIGHGNDSEVFAKVLIKYLGSGWAMYKRVDTAESSLLTFISGKDALPVELELTGAYKVVNK